MCLLRLWWRVPPGEKQAILIDSRRTNIMAGSSVSILSSHASFPKIFLPLSTSCSTIVVVHRLKSAGNSSHGNSLGSAVMALPRFTYSQSCKQQQQQRAAAWWR